MDRRAFAFDWFLDIMKKIAIITPTYNEARNIPELCQRLEAVCKKIKGVDFTLIVVDDSSPDLTAQAARSAAKKVTADNFRITVLSRKVKDGIGKAYVFGFNYALKKNFDYIMQIDADLSHNPKYVADMVRSALKDGNDFVVGSRYIKGGGVSDWGLHRRLLSRGGNIYIRTFLGSKITDYTGGFNLFSADLLRQIETESLDSGGYGFFIELKYSAVKHAQNLGQIPIIFSERKHGKSKLAKNTLLLNLLLVPRLKFGSHR